MRNFAIGLLLLALAVPAAAADDDNALSQPQSCSGQSGKAGSADDIIADCTQAIQSGRLTGAALGHALTLRGEAYRAGNRFVRALADFEQALRLQPSLAILYFDRGSAYFGLGLPARSIPDFDHAIRLDPRLAPAYANRGGAYAFLNQFDRGVADSFIAILLKPNYAQAYFTRGLSFGFMNQSERAISDFNIAIRLKPDFAAAFYARSRIYFTLDRFDLALADLDQALRLKPGAAEILAARDFLQMRMAEIANAANAPSSEAPAQNPDAVMPSRAIGGTHECASAYPPLSRGLFENGDVRIRYDVGADGAIANVSVLKSSGSTRLDQAAVWCVSARWRNTPAMKGTHPIASLGHQAIVRFTISPPSDGPAFDIRGRAHASIGEYDQALQDFDSALAAKPDLAEAYFGRGNADVMLGKYPQAIVDYDHAVQLKPDYDEAQAARDLAKWEAANPPQQTPPPVPHGPDHSI